MLDDSLAVCLAPGCLQEAYDALSKLCSLIDLHYAMPSQRSADEHFGQPVGWMSVVSAYLKANPSHLNHFHGIFETLASCGVRV